MIPSKEIVPGFNLPVVEFAANQDEYITLPAHIGEDGVVTTRWKLNWRERFRLLIHGDLWLSVMTFRQPLQPVKLDTECPLFGHYTHDEEV